MQFFVIACPTAFIYSFIKIEDNFFKHSYLYNNVFVYIVFTTTFSVAGNDNLTVQWIMQVHAWKKTYAKSCR